MSMNGNGIGTAACPDCEQPIAYCECNADGLIERIAGAFRAFTRPRSAP